MARKMQTLHRAMPPASSHGEGSGAFRWRSGGMYRPGADRPASVDSASRKGNAGAVSERDAGKQANQSATLHFEHGGDWKGATLRNCNTRTCRACVAATGF